jgi:hypothetical protein
MGLEVLANVDAIGVTETVDSTEVMHSSATVA